MLVSNILRTDDLPPVRPTISRSMTLSAGSDDVFLEDGKFNRRK